MSRVVALFHRDRRPAASIQLLQIIAPLRRDAGAGPRTWVEGPGGLAYQCFRDGSDPEDLQPVADSGNVALCFDGRLDNRDELADLLDLSGELPRLSDCSIALACYRRFGESFATHLNGDFALALFDSSARRLLLARDPMGIRPLYFWDSSDTFVAASEIKAILAHPEVEARPDDVTIADVVVGGDPTELRRTFFHSVRRVLPGHTLVVTEAGVREFRHWDFDVTRQARCASLDEYAGTLRALFEQAVRRRLRSSRKVAVTVSGGLDSSAILCQAAKLHRAGAAVAVAHGISMVFPDGSPADEKRYLDDIEKLYRVQVRRLPFSSFHYVDEEHWLRQIEYPRVYWNSEFEIFDIARRLGCDTLLDGYHGDQVMSSNAHLFELIRSLRLPAARREAHALAQSMTDCSPRLLQRWLVHDFLRDLAPDWLMRNYRRIRRLRDSGMYPRWFARNFRELAFRRSQQQRRPAIPFASKQAEICYRHFLAPHRLDIVEQVNKIAAVYGFQKAYPFMDRDLIAFIISVPSSVMNWDGVFKGLFREAMRGVLPENIRCRKWKADFTALNSGAAASGYPRFQRYLRPDCLSVQFGYIDPATLQSAFFDHRSKLNDQNKQPAIQVNSAVGLELWLRAFFQNPRSPSEKVQYDMRQFTS